MDLPGVVMAQATAAALGAHKKQGPASGALSLDSSPSDNTARDAGLHIHPAHAAHTTHDAHTTAAAAV